VGGCEVRWAAYEFPVLSVGGEVLALGLWGVAVHGGRRCLGTRTPTPRNPDEDVSYSILVAVDRQDAALER